MNYGSRENGVTTNRPQLALSLGHAPPTITITSPADGDYLTHAGPIMLTADATPADGAITNVAFYDGATLLGADTTSPYTITANLAGGTHLLTASATDANGLTKTSLVSRIDVAYPPTAPSATLNTPRNNSIDIDLRTLASDVETPVANLRFTLGAATNGTVMMLADGHTARFTPSLGYTGPATFAYSVTDTSNDDRLLLNYDFQSSDATDATGQDRDGTINLQGTGTATYTNDFPAALAPYHTQSLHLNEYGTNGAGRVERILTTTEVDFPNDNWTIAGWFKRSTATNMDAIVQLGDSGGYASSALTLAFYGTSTTLSLANYNGSTQDVNITTNNVSSGVWHHFAITRSGLTLSLYLDGKFAGSDTGFGFTFDNSKPVKFGGVTTSVLDRWLNGSLADLAVFNAALGSTEILKLNTMPVSYFGGQSASNRIAVNVLTPMETWRLASFGTITNIGSAADTADPDGDGRNNLAEYIAGTNPTNIDVPSALSVTNFSKKLVLKFAANAASGAGYTGLTRYFDLLSSTNSVAGLWTGVLNYTNIVGNNQIVTYTNAAGVNSAFYKLQIRLQ
ncbi:MAG: LamG-like jellyroll fold domain-containing protein [Verrucomicrobiota bacterium]